MEFSLFCFFFTFCIRMRSAFWCGKSYLPAECFFFQMKYYMFRVIYICIDIMMIAYCLI